MFLGARTYLLLAVAVFVLAAGAVFAHGDKEHEPTRVELPTDHMAIGDKCVEETDFMIRNHMALLMHQRDGTVHDGVRTKKYSLRGCLSCHAPANPPAKDGVAVQPASIASGKHFCAECHTYVAVKIDCFECHAELGEAR